MTATLTFKAPESCVDCMLSVQGKTEANRECSATEKRENISQYSTARAPGCPLAIAGGAKAPKSRYRYVVEFQNTETCTDICYREYSDESDAKAFERTKLNSGAKQVKLFDRGAA